MASPLRHATAPTAEINVTPMLDVLLVLLIMFISLSIQKMSVMDTQLAQPCGAPCAGSAGIVLEVLPGQQYRINRDPVAAPDLPARLRVIYANRPMKILQVAGAPDVRYRDVVAAMDIARSAGVTVIGVPPKETVVR